MAILNVVERAYHGTIEEQDDTILWITAAMKNAGGDMQILLRSNAVNYAVKGQEASGLSIGGVALKVAPTIDKDIEELLKNGVKVYAVAEDLKKRGIDKGSVIAGVQLVSQKDTLDLWDNASAVWHW
ncbi:MAG: DsrE family protein [Chloroflexi bacterium]|nr:DsrE family protein [Chloroflexota bacterium]